jgi:hypothetical protein
MVCVSNVMVGDSSMEGPNIRTMPLIPSPNESICSDLVFMKASVNNLKFKLHPGNNSQQQRQQQRQQQSWSKKKKATLSIA